MINPTMPQIIAQWMYVNWIDWPYGIFFKSLIDKNIESGDFIGLFNIKIPVEWKPIFEMRHLYSHQTKHESKIYIFDDKSDNLSDKNPCKNVFDIRISGESKNIKNGIIKVMFNKHDIKNLFMNTLWGEGYVDYICSSPQLVEYNSRNTISHIWEWNDQEQIQQERWFRVLWARKIVESSWEEDYPWVPIATMLSSPVAHSKILLPPKSYLNLIIKLNQSHLNLENLLEQSVLHEESLLLNNGEWKPHANKTYMKATQFQYLPLNVELTHCINVPLTDFQT